MVEKLNSLEMINELDNMSESLELDGASLRSISDIEAFRKSLSYRALRKNQLSKTEMSVFFHYVYTNEDIVALIMSKIKNLDIIKGIEYGIINSMCITNSLLAGHFLEKFFVLNTKIESSGKDLETFIQFFNYRKIYNKSTTYDINVFTNLIAELWFGKQLDFEARQRKENLLILKKYYKEVFDYIQSVEPRLPRLSIDSSGENYPKPFSMEYTKNKLVFNIKPIEVSKNYESFKNKQKINEILAMFIKCPYLDIDFANSLIDEFSLFAPVEKLYLKLSFLMHSEADPFIDLYKEFKKISCLHSIWGIDIPLPTLTTMVMNHYTVDMKRFNLRLNNLIKLSREEKKNLYIRFFHLETLNNEAVNKYEERLKLMIFLGTDDIVIANFIQFLFDEGQLQTFHLNDVYPCINSKRETYPGIQTLKIIAAKELSQLFNPNPTITTEELWDKYYNVNFSTMNPQSFLTWKMANSTKFLKKIIFSSKINPPRKRNLMASMNLNNIGFKRYLILLEDYSRLKARKFFSEVSRNSLKFATKTELYMYKNKIPAFTLLGSKSINYKVIDYFLFLKAKHELHNIGIYIDMSPLNHGLMKNKNISKIELVDILERLNNIEKSCFLYSVRSVLDESGTLSINILGQESNILSVKDFCDYYDKGGNI